jgi:hypothetical protein
VAKLTDIAQKRFEAALNRYSEDNFFYIANNYLGPVKSPFHKPQLTARLSLFFNQQQIQDRMVELLDELDVTILSLLILTGPIATETVIDLLAPRFGYTTIFWRLSALQLRLILLGEDGRLVFNPLIETRLFERCSLSSLIGACDTLGEERPHVCIELLRAYLSLVLEEQRLGFRESHLAIFPSFEEEHLRLLIPLLGDLLQRLGVFRATKPPQVVDDRVEALLSLTDEQLACILLAATMSGPPITSALSFSCDVLSLLKGVGSIEEGGLSLLLRILSKRHTIDCPPTFAQSMVTLGIIGEGPVHRVMHLDRDEAGDELLVDSDFTINYLGTRKEGDLLHRFATITTFDVQRQWRVSKQSVVRAFDSGLSFSTIEAYLTAHTRGGSAASLIKQMALLDERYGMLTIHDALTLVVDERVAHLVEHLPALSEHHIKKLSPTIFLMRRDSEERWRKILTDAGQLVGSTQRQALVTIKEEAINPYFFDYIDLATTERERPGLVAQRVEAEPVFDETLRQAIMTSSLLNEAQRVDLLSRYDERLILSPSQIAAQVLDAIIEAGGFDYQGKLALCRQAVGKKHITLQLRIDEEEILVWALEVSSSSEGEALLKALVLTTKAERIIPIRKIFTVRLLRTQLF